MNPIIISLVIRLVTPLLIFKLPFFGYLAAIFADSFFDGILVSLLGGDFGGGYQFFDKWLDLYMITIAVIYSLRFKKIEKYTCITLYVFRVIGVILFEITQLRILLIFFPNLFDFFFLFLVTTHKFFPKFELTKKNLWIVLIALLIPKMFQEILIHYIDADVTGFFWNAILSVKNLFIS